MSRPCYLHCYYGSFIEQSLEIKIKKEQKIKILNLNKSVAIMSLPQIRIDQPTMMIENHTKKKKIQSTCIRKFYDVYKNSMTLFLPLKSLN